MLHVWLRPTAQDNQFFLLTSSVQWLYNDRVGMSDVVVHCDTVVAYSVNPLNLTPYTTKAVVGF